ncbi:MAG: restriction endonuclease subunit S [Shewanella sp.]
MSAEKLITDHIDIWTSAVQAKSASGRGSSKKRELYGIKKLRELILELAVRGKLVPQDPSDESASVLLERIAAEKAQLLKTKSIKQPKLATVTTESLSESVLPAGWTKCLLGELLPQFQNGASSRGDKDGKLTTVLRLADIDNWKVSLKDTRELEIAQSSVDRYSIEKGDTLIIRVNGSADIVGRFIVCKESLDAIYCDHFIRMRFPIECFDPAFLSILGSSGMVRNVIGDLFVSTAGQKTINQGHLASIEILLPPLNEQHRIVAKVDELMALCDQLEQRSESQLAAHQTLVETLLATLTDSSDGDELAQNWARLSTHFDTLFTTEASIDALKQTILQLAVMGKLVPQDPSDEPASALLARIAAEKALLVKEKKIKKEKPLPAISEDEKPFELPKGWTCCRISDLGYDLGGGTPSKTKSKYWNGNIPWVSPKDMKVDFISSSTDYVTEDAISETVIKLIPSNSLLMVVRGMILAHSFPVALTMAPVAINQDMKALVFSEINEVYLLTLMKAARERVVSMVEHSSHGTCKLVSEKLWSMVVCIPPKEEQLRIIKTVDTLMTICGQLKFRLQTSQQIQLALAEALVEQAL